jgi:hypothetical protein
MKHINVPERSNFSGRIKKNVFKKWKNIFYEQKFLKILNFGMNFVKLQKDTYLNEFDNKMNMKFDEWEAESKHVEKIVREATVFYQRMDFEQFVFMKLVDMQLL